MRSKVHDHRKYGTFLVRAIVHIRLKKKGRKEEVNLRKHVNLIKGVSKF